MPDAATTYYFSAIPLSNFAQARRLYLIERRYQKKVRITPEVLNELDAGIVAGYPAAMKIEMAIHRGMLCVEEIFRSPEERAMYRTLLRCLSSGEASCITHAMIRSGIVVTDDRAARDCCIKRGLRVTGTIGILMACCRDHSLAPEEADQVLQSMIREGYRSPLHRISDIL